MATASPLMSYVYVDVRTAMLIYVFAFVIHMLVNVEESVMYKFEGLGPCAWIPLWMASSRISLAISCLSY